LSGGADDVWILQIAGNLSVSNGVAVHLAGGAQAKNVFWQVAGMALLGTTSHLEGIVLSKTLIAMRTGASINGNLYAQTAVTLEMNVVTEAAAGPAQIQTPAPGSTLGTTNVTFTWNAALGASAYELFLGTNGEGSSNLYKSGSTTATTVTVSSLPSGGSPVFAYLCSQIGDAWKCNSTTYKESGTSTLAVLQSPTAGSTLGAVNVEFTWSPGVGVAAYELFLGTEGKGSSNLYKSGVTTATAAIVPGVPANGVPVYAYFCSEIGGAWSCASSTYTEP
jgi:hypothetical protein